LFFFLKKKGDSKLGDVLGLDYKDLLPVLGKLASSTTVKALIASEALQKWLVEQATTNVGLMLGFIGECKAIMNSSQQPSPAVSPVTVIQGERFFPMFCLSAFFQ
jgi:hypothetical protein